MVLTPFCAGYRRDSQAHRWWARKPTHARRDVLEGVHWTRVGLRAGENCQTHDSAGPLGARPIKRRPVVEMQQDVNFCRWDKPVATACKTIHQLTIAIIRIANTLA